MSQESADAESLISSFICSGITCYKAEWKAHIHPLTFKEFMQVYDGDMYHGWADYVVYGGLPLTVTMKTEEQKVRYLETLFTETYIKDIVERNGNILSI